MESENPNLSARRHRDLVPVYDVDKPFPPSWFSSTQAYHAMGSIPTMTPSLPYFYESRWGNQTWNEPLRYDYLQNPRRLSNYPMITGMNQEYSQPSCMVAALVSSESVRRLSGGKNPGAMQTPDGKLQLQSPVIPKGNLEGVPRSVASGRVISPEGGREAKNDSPSTKMQPCNMKPGNGEDAQKVTSVENSDAVHQNGSPKAANPTELNQKLEKGPSASGTNSEPEEQEEEETRKARKRQANRESCRRTRLKKKKQYQKLYETVDNLRDENAELKKQLRRLSEECSELTNENDSILEELVDKYGEEAIANLSKQSLPEPESIAGDKIQSFNVYQNQSVGITNNS